MFKAFNTIFGHVLEKDRPLDVFIAGGNAQAKAALEAFIESLGLPPLDVGGLEMAHWLEGAGLLLMGLARHGAGNWDLAPALPNFTAELGLAPRRRRARFEGLPDEVAGVARTALQAGYGVDSRRQGHRLSVCRLDGIRARRPRRTA